MVTLLIPTCFAKFNFQKEILARPTRRSKPEIWPNPGVLRRASKIKGPLLAIMPPSSCASFVLLVFTAARRQLLLKSSILVANKSLRIFNITKMAAKRSQCAILNGQYWVFKSVPAES